MAKDLVVVIQARTGSSRLPRKVLADLHGRPMLRFQLDRLQGLTCDHLVVATSDLAADDAVEIVAKEAGADVVRGSATDVLGRFGAVLERFEAETVVRLTGDNPLVDPALVAEVVALHGASDVDYSSNVHPRSFPKGLDVEAASAAALAAAVVEATDPYDREHVTPFLYRHPERFRMANLVGAADVSDMRWTVDTAEDLDRVRRIVALLDDPLHTPWTEMLATVERNGIS